MTEITNTEFEVLEALWVNYPATANSIIEQLNKNKPWHEKTVKTLINRLVKKEAIGFEKQGRSYLYYPLVERDSYMATQSQSFIDRLFRGRVSPLVAGFAKTNNLKKEDIEELKALIEKWEQDND
ncbi:CopY family transcriptional repressor [Saccharobesus litoralis]|uniref:CopY family transcriptional repressor n=1 Tax=Saccharobesus litoralis TaxID=2172099 RepID=A0A2S0VPP5_9ALTE|nr:BlaI/MecI/CopY family transcriptional regulator [Saccharobesus litoralis]AWB66163.1 CopY family transcriptional repressor [Saccharobesus litoralis]